MVWPLGRKDPLGSGRERTRALTDAPPREVLPKPLRRFYDIYDQHFQASMRGRFEAWVATRSQQGDERWAELTTQIRGVLSQHEGLIQQNIALDKTEREKIATLLARVEAVEVAAKAAAEKAAAPRGADPETLAKAKEMEDRLMLLEDGAGAPREREPPPIRRRPPQRWRARTETEEETADGEPEENGEEEEPEEEPRPEKKQPRTKTPKRGTPPWLAKRQKPAPKSESGGRPDAATIETMLDQTDPDDYEAIDLPGFLWAVIEADGEANRDVLADCFKKRTIRLGIANIEAAAKGLSLESARTKEGETVYAKGANSRPPV